MKVSVWVAIGGPPSSIYYETGAQVVDLTTSAALPPVKFELPMGVRLDERGPIRVVIEPITDEAPF